MEKKENVRSRYVALTLEEICLNGDAYVSEDTLYKACRERKRDLAYGTFKADLAEQIRLGAIHIEGRRMYNAKTWRYEECAARCLRDILRRPALPRAVLPEVLKINGIVLCGEQRRAVELALSNRLSLILGGAGSGKSTLVQAIVNVMGPGQSKVLCAPTGKAARNLTERTGLTARTVHSALGMHPDEDFLAPVVWSSTDLVIVDEASMMTLEMLAGILYRVTGTCRVVLLGDSNQLLSVGSGNVLPDLLELGIPCVRLEENHRQDEEARALLRNVVNFSALRRGQELAMDESFILRELCEPAIQKALTDEAVRRYLAGESVQVLSPYNRATQLSVYVLNQIIREQVNPLTYGKKVITHRGRAFRDGDRVMITRNDRERNCSNGEVGILHIQRVDKEDSVFQVELPDGRCPSWDENQYLELLSLAYALTVHKAQGNEYDTILFPVSLGMYGMLSRNLFYTAISRAKKAVILYGDPQAVDVAMQKPLPQRKSILVQKTRMLLERCA